MQRQVVIPLVAVALAVASFYLVRQLSPKASGREQRMREFARSISVDENLYVKSSEIRYKVSAVQAKVLTHEEAEILYQAMLTNHPLLITSSISAFITGLPDELIPEYVDKAKAVADYLPDRNSTEFLYVFLWNRAPHEKGWVLADARKRFPDYAKEIEKWPPVLTKTNHPSSR